jgi:thiol:disulfide interchange protein
MTMRIKRVGTLTMGLSLICAGVLFAIHLFIPGILTYYYIFRLWPLILILLGAEVLFANMRNREDKILYDGWAIFIMALAMILAGTLAGCQILLDYGITQGHIVF